MVNALRLLECFAREEELGITDLSEAVGVGKTVTARLVSSLEQFGYLRQNPAARKYRPGMKLVYLGSLVQDRKEIVQLVEPCLRLLSREFQVSAHLAVQERYGSLVMSKVSMGPMVCMDSRVGNTLPLHASATGKCPLAFGGEQGVEQYMRNCELTRCTDMTITTPAAGRKRAFGRGDLPERADTVCREEKERDRPPPGGCAARAGAAAVSVSDWRARSAGRWIDERRRAHGGARAAFL